jgi:hypothetical protein
MGPHPIQPGVRQIGPFQRQMEGSAALAKFNLQRMALRDHERSGSSNCARRFVFDGTVI